jgi:hypothetical protein
MGLRPITEIDADNLYRLDNDPAVTWFLNGGRPTSREAIKTQILPGSRARLPVPDAAWTLGGG